MSEYRVTYNVEDPKGIKRKIVHLLTTRKPKIFPYVKSFKEYERLRCYLRDNCYNIRPIISEHKWDNCWEIKKKSEDIQNKNVRDLVKNEYSLYNDLKTKSTTSLFD